MGQLASTIKEKFQDLMSEFVQGLSRVPFYADIPLAVRQALASQYLNLAAQGMETHDLSPLAEFLRQRAQEVLLRGYQAESLLQALGVFEETLWPLIDSTVDARFFGYAASKLREVVSYEIAAMLTRSESRLRQLLERLPVGVFRTTQDGQLIEANPTFLEIVGYESVQAVNRVGVQAFYQDPQERQRLLSLLAQGPVTDFQTRFKQANGQLIDVTIYVHLVMDAEGRPQFLEGVIENVSERIQSAERAHWRLEQLRHVTELTARLSPERQVDALCRQAIELGRESLGIDRMSIWLKGDRPGYLQGTFGTDEQGRTRDERSQLMPVDYESEMGRVLLGSLPDWEAFEPLRDHQGHAVGEGWHIVVPISDASGQVLGILLADQLLTQRGWDNYMVEILRLYGLSVGRLIESVRVLRQLADSQQMLRLIMDNIPQSVFWKNRNLVYMGCNREFALRRGLMDTDEVVGKTDYDLSSREQADRYRADDMQVIESGQARLNYEEPQVTARGEHRWLRTSKIPLRNAADEVVAVLCMYEDITAQKRLEEEMRRRLNETLLLNRVMSITSTAVDANAVLDALCRETAQALHLPQAGVALLRPDGQNLELVAHYRTDGQPSPLGLLISVNGNPGTQRVLEQRTPIVISDVLQGDQEVEFYPTARALGIVSMLIVPLIVQDRVVGTLGLDSFEPREFTPDEIALAQSVAAVASQTLQNLQVQNALRESRQMLQSVIDNIPQTVFWKGRDMAFMGCNQAFAQNARLNSPDDIVGKTDFDLWWSDRAERFQQDDRAVIESGVPILNQEHVRWNADGSQGWGVQNKIPLRDEHGEIWAVLGTSEDITGRKLLEQAARLDEIRLEAMLRLNQMTAASEQEIADYALEASVQITQSQIGYLAFMSDDESVLTMYAWSRTAMDECAVLDKPIVYPVVETGLWGEAVRQREPVITNDYAAPSSLKRGYPAGHVQVKRHMNIPVFDGERIVAVAGVGNKEGPYDQADVRQLTLLMEGMWQIIRRRRLEEQARESLERRGRQVQTGTEIAQEIASAQALDELFNRVVTLIKERFGYYHAQIFRYDVAAQSLVLMAGYGEAGLRMLAGGHRLPLGAGVVGAAASTGQTVLVAEVARAVGWQANPNLPDTKGELAVPIKWRDQVLGILDVQSDQAGALTSEDQFLLEGLCGQIAIAIENTRLRQEMEENLRELNAAYRAISREGWQAFRQTAALPGGYVFDGTAAHPADDLWLPEIGQAVRSGAMARPTNQGAAVLPLTVPGGEVIGAMGIYDDPQRPLADEEWELVRSVADQVAQSLESARLVQQTQAALSETGVLYQTTQALNAAETLEQVLLALVPGLGLADRSLISLNLFNRPWMGDDMPEQIQIMALWDRQPELGRAQVGMRFEVASFSAAWLLKPDVPLVIGDFEADSRIDPVTRALYRERFQARSTVIFPLVVGGRWIGYLDMLADQVVELSDADLRRVTALVGQAAIAIQNLLRLQESESRARHEQDLREMTARVRTPTDVDGVLRALAWEIGQMMGRRVMVGLGEGLLSGDESSSTGRPLPRQEEIANDR